MPPTTDLYVWEEGPREAPSILLLHGAGVSGRMFEPAVARLPDYHCLVPDLPEHGRSRSVPLSIPDTVRRLAELIRRRATGGRAHLVGISWGGVVAQALMQAEPDLIDHVLLSGTSMRLNRWLAALNALNEPILRLLSAKQRTALLMAQFGVPPACAGYLREDLSAFSPETFGRVNRTYLDIVTPRSGRWPVLVLVGEKETPVAKWMARRLAAAMPGATGRLVPGAGHLWPLQQPELFARVLQAWLADAPLPQPLRPL